MKMGQITGTIVAHRNDGMGARLIAMLNAIRVARDNQLPWHVCWTTHGMTRPELRDPTQIFDPDFVAERFSDVDMMRDLYEDLIDLSTLQDPDGQTSFEAQVQAGRNFLSGQAMGVVALPWEDPAAAAAALPGCLSELRFSEPVREMIARIDKVLAGSTLTAFHIRRGDIIHHPIASNKPWPNKYIPREFYELQLQRVLEDPAARVLCFSDTPLEVERLKARSDRVVSFDDLLGESELTLGARDFLELYAMSRCARIYGPPSSAFSQTAVVVGGGTLQAVEEALSPEDRTRALDLMADRLEAKSPLFLNLGDVGQCLHFLVEHEGARGNHARAKRIIESYMEIGLDKSYAYALLCALSVSAGELQRCPKIRDLAYRRPVYVDDSMAAVNSYAALAHLESGDAQAAHRALMAAFWFRPLEPLLHGTLCLALSAGVVSPETFYPFDPLLVREKAQVFPKGRKALDELNGITPAGMDADARRLFHPWEIVVRDWKLVTGKKLNRAFTNKSKIARTRKMMCNALSHLEGTPALMSALGVLDRALGKHERALELQRAAVAAEPEVALYRKRLSDTLFETEDQKNAIGQLRRASVLSQNHPCYVTELAFQLHRAQERDEAKALFDRLSRTRHDFLEIDLMVAEALRRDSGREAEALALVEHALELGHGSMRLMAAQARLLMLLGREKKAREVYQTMVDWGIGTEYTHVQILRQYREIGREDLARALIEQSAFEFDTIREMTED